jgi:CO/xanthine dehydrogenase Mo-binding subunit
MAAFAVESTMDIVADAIGMDAVDLRLKNVAKEGA